MMVPSRQERENLVLDLYYNQNKNYRQIAKEAKICPRDIKTIVDRAYNEKDRQQNRSLSTQAYELFSKGKKPVEVAIMLNIGEGQVTQYYTEYLRLIQLDDVTQIYRELKGDVWYFVNLCKAAKSAGMNVQHVSKLLKIAGNSLPSAEHRYEVLQKQNNSLEYTLRTQAKEFQNLTTQISAMGGRLDSIKLDCEKEEIRLDDLQQKNMKQEDLVKHYETNNELYVKITKTLQDKVEGILSDKKALLRFALLSLTESMRNDPEKFSSSIYFDTAAYYNRKQAYTDMLIEEADKLYSNMVKELVDESISEHVFNTTTSLSSLTPTDKEPQHD